MTGRVGYEDGQRLWVRCPECGDSQHDQTKAHCNIDLRRFVYYCYRCGSGGKLSSREILNLVDQWNLDLGIEKTQGSTSLDELPELVPGAGSHRDSALDRYHFIHRQKTYDAFYLREPRDNTICGVHLRSGKLKISLGDLGYAWPHAEPLVSSISDPLFLVEGPYDVLTDRFVSVMGLIAMNRLKLLSGHFVVLFPDGDVWQDTFLLRRTITTLRSALMSNRIYVAGMIFIPGGGDPDDYQNRFMNFYIPREEILSVVSHHLKKFHSTG